MSYSEPPPPQYGAPQQPYGQQPQKTSGKAIGSLVTGILSLPGVCCWPLGLALAIAGIVLGVLGRKDIAASQGQQKGTGMAIAGIVCGAVAIAIIAVSLILVATGTIDTTYEFDTSS